jgi:hypothetical protein
MLGSTHPVTVVLALVFSIACDRFALANTNIPAGKKLRAGQSVASSNGKVILQMQGDGNLILLWTRDNGTRVPVWNSRTNDENSTAEMQGDGNFVIYAPGHKSVWSTRTHRNPGSVLVVQNDGNLVLYKDRRPLWSSGTDKPERRPVRIRDSKQRMDMTIKISRTGIIEAKREATIKKQSGSWRHIYWFALLDEDDNTVWVSPVETLTLGAKLNTLGQPVDHDKDATANYTIDKDKADKVWSAVVYMKQQAPGGSVIDQIEDAVKTFKRIDDAYKTMKSLEIVKDGAKAVAAAG